MLSTRRSNRSLRTWKQKGVTNVLGFNVELDHWLEDAVHGQDSELETTRQDANS